MRRTMYRGLDRIVTRSYAVIATTVFLLLSTSVSAQDWTEEQKLTANDAVAGIGFGDAISLGDDIALVGATANGLANLSAGAVYVLERNPSTDQWEHVTKLEADDGELDDRFGWSVSLDGDVALIGAPDEEDGGVRAGAAYVFRNDGSTWSQEQKLIATGPDDVSGFRFGRSGAINGNLAVVGAPDADGAGGPTGAAFVFVYKGAETGWVQTQTMLEESFISLAGYGAGVAAYGLSEEADIARVIIGAPRAGTGAQNFGAVYTYRFQADTLAFEQKLTASPQDEQDMFGESVALDGTVAIIGAPQDDDLGAYAGAAHIFRWHGDEWVFEQKLLASDGAEDDHFGQTVAIQGNVAVVGAPDHEGGALGSGTVYVFEFDGESWSETEKLGAGDPGIGDHFGESLAFDGSRIFIGASNNDDGGESAGSAYVFAKGGMGTAVEDAVPTSFSLSLEAYPNPFADHATISYELPEAGIVELAVYDVLGRLVVDMSDRPAGAGAHTTSLSMENLPSGMYFIRLRTRSAAVSRRLTKTE